MEFFNTKCEYLKQCNWYRKDSATCNKSPGPYCGIWRSWEEIKNDK